MKSREHKVDPNADAYSYLRFSSSEQAKGDSVRRQTEMRNAWCAKHLVHFNESLSLRDEGISAFTGDHRKNPDRHALAGFLELVRQGKVKRGSYLIIENLDRLTREDTVPAVHLFTGLLLAGIRIVQLDPETIFSDRSDSMDVMRAVLEMSRGHSESANKSRRMGEVWGKKRKEAAAGVVISRSCPAWIRVEGKGDAAKYVLIPERARVVKRVFAMATDGHGARAIRKRLDADKVPPFGKAWNVSYIKLLLASRQTFGEFTPRERGKGGNALQRKPVAPPIPNYYPAAITEDEFFAAQSAVQSRKGKAGRPAKEFVNVFAALLWDARTRGRLHLAQYQRDGKKSRFLTPYAALNRGEKHVGFPLDIFEDALFGYLSDIDPREVLPDAGNPATEVLALRGRLKDTEEQLGRLKVRLRTENEVDTVLDAVRELEAERKQLADDLTASQTTAAAPTSEAWGEFKGIRSALAAAPDQDAARVRLRAALCRMVESVWCLFMPGTGARVAWVQVVFAGGEKFHHFAIVYRARHGLPGGKEYPANYAVRDLATAMKTGDLRDEKNARALEDALDVDSKMWDEVVPHRNQRAIRSVAHAERKVGIDARHKRWAQMRAGKGKKKPMSYGAIAKAEGVSQSTVYKALHKEKNQNR